MCFGGSLTQQRRFGGLKTFENKIQSASFWNDTIIVTV